MSGTFHILLVEDNEGDVDILKRVFSRTGADITLTWAENGERALKLLEKSDTEHFDVMLLDLNLPGISGLSLLKQLKDQAWLRSMPVVVLTSSRSQTDISNAYSGDASLYIVKPSGAEGYARLARYIVDCWFGDDIDISRPDDMGAGYVKTFDKE